MTKKANPFHLVEQSPWPLIASMGALSITMSMIMMMNTETKNLVYSIIILLIIVSYTWWRDIFRESSSQGHHPMMVMNGLKTGMILFISSEILFFTSFFWGFFHSSISPTFELGLLWPAQSIISFNPMSIPLLNTIILLSSGVTVTWSHHNMFKKSFKTSKNALFLTILLGMIFTMFQAFEYMEAPFSMSDSAFGSTFFMATGFHGLHVIIGSTFLFITFMRFNKMNNSPIHIIGFECAAWYWHFVDVVWLFLYSMLYWWGACYQ